MRWIITEPDGARAALTDEESRFHPEPRPSCLPSVREDLKLTRQERLDVYAEAYYSRLCRILEEDFPAVRRKLGESAFRALVSDYLLDHPSRSHELVELARAMPGFLREWLEPGEGPQLPDLAALEFAHWHSFLAPDAPARDPARLSQADPEQVKLSLAPSTHVVVSPWQIGALRARLRDAQATTPLAALEEPAAELQRLVVYREQGGVRCESVSAAELMLIEAARDGLTLGVACERLGEISEATADALFQWLSKWASRGALLCDIP